MITVGAPSLLFSSAWKRPSGQLFAMPDRRTRVATFITCCGRSFTHFCLGSEWITWDVTVKENSHDLPSNTSNVSVSLQVLWLLTSGASSQNKEHRFAICSVHGAWRCSGWKGVYESSSKTATTSGSSSSRNSVKETSSARLLALQDGHAFLSLNYGCRNY